MIVEGEMAPGDRIPERVLCGWFGVSRTPLREALKVLASEGLVELLPNRGARIMRFTIEDIEEMFVVIGALEALAGELACANIRDDAIAEIRALHYRMVLHHTRREIAEYFKLNQQIHERIISAAGNKVLSDFHKSLASRIRPYRYMTNLSNARWAKAVRDHEQILEALSSRQGPKLAELLRLHLQSKCEIVKAEMAVARKLP